MGILTEDERMNMVLAHRKIFEAVCDDCGKLIQLGSLYQILKYTRNKWVGPGPKPYGWQTRVPKKVRCMACYTEHHPPKVPKKVKILGKGKKHLSEEDAKKINITVKKIAIRILKKSGEPIETKTFKERVFLKAKKKDQKIKKAMVNATLSALRKARIMQVKRKAWILREI